MASATIKRESNTPKQGDASMERAKEAGAEAIEKAKEAGGQAIDKARDAGAEALAKAKEAAGSVGEMAGHAVAAVGEKANDWTAAAGREVQAAGDALGHKAADQAFGRQASQAVADTLKEGGRYLQEAKLSGMAQDVAQVIEKHPFPAMCVFLGIGYCLGRILKD